MKVGDAIAEIMKREGIELLFGYPVNHLIEFAAKADIRPIIVRQERVGLHMADAISRLSSGRKIGAFCMQHGPGTENAYGGVAQAFGETVPILVLPMGYPRRLAHVGPNYNPVQSMSSVTKSAEPIMLAAEDPEHHAPRLHPPAQRARRAGAGGNPERSCGTRRCRSRSTTRRSSPPATARTPRTHGVPHGCSRRRAGR